MSYNFYENVGFRLVKESLFGIMERSGVLPKKRIMKLASIGFDKKVVTLLQEMLALDLLRSPFRDHGVISLSQPLLANSAKSESSFHKYTSPCSLNVIETDTQTVSGRNRFDDRLEQWVSVYELTFPRVLKPNFIARSGVVFEFYASFQLAFHEGMNHF